MARPIATDYNDGVFTDSQTWSATIASASETTLGNITVPEDEVWNIYAIWAQGTGGEYRLDCTGSAATLDMFEFGGPVTVGATIKLVSKDTTTKTYICVAENGSGDDNGTVTDGKVEFEAGASTGAHAAAHFKTAVEHANGHAGKITVTNSSAESTLAQNTIGKEGNTLVTASESFNASLDTTLALEFTGGTDGISSIVGKYIQNSDGDTAKDSMPYDVDLMIPGPCVLTIYVTNNDSASTVCKGMINYIRIIRDTEYSRYDENGLILDDE